MVADGNVMTRYSSSSTTTVDKDILRTDVACLEIEKTVEEFLNKKFKTTRDEDHFPLIVSFKNCSPRYASNVLILCLVILLKYQGWMGVFGLGGVPSSNRQTDIRTDNNKCTVISMTFPCLTLTRFSSFGNDI